MLPTGIIIRVQENGWMDGNLVADWLKTVWGKHVGLRRPQSILILDAYRSHLTESVKKLNTNLVIIPRGMTSQLQVLYVVVNKPFNDHLKRQYSNWLRSADHAYTPTGRMKRSVSVLCEWVLEAWNAIFSDRIIHGFKKCCIATI
jgi:hypothetical protein